MRNPQSVPENETQKILRDLGILTAYQISTRRPDLVITNNNNNNNNKTCQIVDFAVPADLRLDPKESEKTDK